MLLNYPTIKHHTYVYGKTLYTFVYNIPMYTFTQQYCTAGIYIVETNALLYVISPGLNILNYTILHLSMHLKTISIVAYYQLAYFVQLKYAK